MSSMPADCPLCASPLPAARGPLERDERGQPVAIRSCRRCHALVPTPDGGVAPSAEAEPVIDGEAGADPARRRLVDEVAADAAAVAWDMAEQLPAPKRCDPIVDLGIGRGAIPDALQRLGYRVRGCEPSAFLCQMARASYLLGPEVLANTDPDSYLSDLEAERPSLSAIVLWHVADRHPDPVDLIGRCARLIPDGLLFLEFPLIRSDELPSGPPFHPTPATLAYLADGLDLALVTASVVEPGGLRVIYRSPRPSVVNLDHDASRRFDPAKLEPAFRAISPVYAHHMPEPRAEQPDQAEIASPG